MGLKLYYLNLCSPCRAVIMCAKVLGVDLEMIKMDLLAGEHMTPEYLKMNPQHTVPVLVDGDLVITESRAALQYLASAYGKDDSLYPKDLKKRALVDQRLFFDAATLYASYERAYYVIFREKKLPEEAMIQKFDEVLGFLEGFLSCTKFVAGDNLTIVDFSIAAMLVTAELGTGHNLSKYPKINEYLANCKALIDNYEEVNVKGGIEFASYIDFRLKQLSETN